MILGYGMQDPDNWDNGVDPYQDEWDEIYKARAERKRLHGEPIKPHRIIEPRAMCIAKAGGNHDLRVVYSGRFRCSRCGFDMESTYQQVGMCFVSNGHTVINQGNGLPPETTQRQAMGYRS